MGVPKLFKIILDKFPASHAKVKGQQIDYFFIDFNSVIYEAYEKIKVDAQGGKKLGRGEIEDRIIKKVIKMTNVMIRDYVKPLKMVYIALDGPAPRGKMIQQRDRRYKRLYENFIKQRIQEKYGVEPEPEIWSTTWITPGTEFMHKMSKALNQAILNNIFPKDVEYVLSDASVAGEGEHKFLKFLDALESSHICIYSNDGDVIMLINRFPQHIAYILTKPKDTSRVVQKYYLEETYMYLVVSGLHQGLQRQFRWLKFIYEGKKLSNNDEDLTESEVTGSEVTGSEVTGSEVDLTESDERGKKMEVTTENVMRDYIFFSMLGGNDFVQHLYFLRMKDEHTFKVLKGIYQFLVPKHGYFVDADLKINQPFMLEYLQKLGYQEGKWLREKQQRMLDSRVKMSQNEKRKYAEMEPWEEEFEIFQHTYYYTKNHPLYEKYKDEFRLIDYTQKPSWKWKKQYYEVFFNVDYNDKKTINRICYQYLKSWYYCLHYYLDEIPSWRWYYPYHASPLPSDLARTLERIKDINTTFKFDKGRPFKPFEQLMLVLPHKNQMLGVNFKKIMEKFPQYYPDKFKLDVLWGQKYIYSEPKLPNINANEVLKEVNKIQLNAKEKELNKLFMDPLFYSVKNE